MMKANNIPKIMMGSFQISSQEIMNQTIMCAIESGCRGFDTSPSYGTETMLGIAIKKAIRNSNVKLDEIFISDKIDGIQMCKSKGDIRMYVESSLLKVGIDYFDLILIHWPFMQYIEKTWDSLVKLKKENKIRYIGLCNINKVKLKDFYTKIRCYPDFIQNEISPLNCDYDIGYYQSKNIIIQAYSPLCRMVDSIKNADILMNLSKKYNKDIAQIILRWHLQRDVIPVFSSKSNSRIISNLDLNNFALTDEEVKSICTLNQGYKIFPNSYGCPGY